MAKIFNYGFLPQMSNSSSIVALAGNGFGLGEGGDFNHKSLIE